MDLEQKAIKRIKMAAEMSQTYYEKPLVIATSGGKDSDICVELARRSGVVFEVQHHHTTADAPQTVYYVREQFKKLEGQGISCGINYPVYKNQRVTMWSLIPQKSMPMTRIARYCCQVMKEKSGAHRVIVTGVRKDESVQRASRGALESVGRSKREKITFDDGLEEFETQTTLEPIYLNNDNSEKRKVMEYCQTKGKLVCNPIIDWTTHDVWDFIHSEKLAVNPLYFCGFQRVGCIGCVMAGKTRYWELEQFPAYERMYRRAFAKMLEVCRQRGITTSWKTADEVFRWWMEDKNLDGQMKLDV